MAELDDILGSLLGNGENDGSKSGESELFDILLRVMPLIETANKESDDERLLKALMPYVGEERRGKLSEAQSLLRIIKLLPLMGQILRGDEK